MSTTEDSHMVTLNYDNGNNCDANFDNNKNKNDENSDINRTNNDNSTDVNNVSGGRATENLCSPGTHNDISYCTINRCSTKVSDVITVNDYYSKFEANFGNANDMNDEKSDNKPTDKDGNDINNLSDESATRDLYSSGAGHDINYCAVNMFNTKDPNVVKVNDNYNNFDANLDNDMNDENSDKNPTDKDDSTDVNNVSEDSELLTLSCVALNVGGLKNKLNFPSFVNFIQSYDIVAITESKFSDTDTVQIDGYTPFYKNRNKFKRKSGGILLLVNDKLLPFINIFENSDLKHKITDNYDKYTFVNHPLSPRALFFTVDQSVLGKSVLFCVNYIEGENSAYFNRQAYAELEENLINLNFDNICFFGDFNSRTANLDDLINDNKFTEEGMEFLKPQIGNRISKDKQTNTMGHELISFCKSNQVAITNGRLGEDKGIGNFTCKDASVVDYVLLSYSLFDQVSNFKIHDFNELFSDCHNAISLIFLRQQPRTNTDMPASDISDNDIVTDCPKDRKQQEYVRWDKNLKDSFVSTLKEDEIMNLNERLDYLASQEQVSLDEVNQVINDCKQIILDPAKKLQMLKTKTARAKINPLPKQNNQWYNTECRQQKIKYYTTRKQSMRDKNNISLQNEVKISAKIYKKTVKKAKNQYKLQFANKLRTLKSKDPKEYWNILADKKVNNAKQTQPPSDTFVDFFRNMWKGEESEPVTNTTNINMNSTDFQPINENEKYQNIDSSCLNLEITNEEVMNSIQNLKTNKTHGIDLILNEFLINSSLKMIDTFVKIFNLVLNTGHVPTEWCIGIIKPIFKNKGSTDDPNNYRGITILSCFGKLFTSVLSNRIQKFIEDSGVLGPEQAGFRKGFSTIDNLFVLYGIIDTLLINKKRLYCAFLDYEKAFDKIERTLLWQKLTEQKINGKILRVIRNIYLAAKSCVLTNDFTLTDLFSIHLGVRQGENLSPVLFALFLNDLQDFLAKDLKGLETILKEAVSCNMDTQYIEKLKNLFILLYADDTVLFSETPNVLQTGLNTLKVYCDLWKLKLNIRKCKIVIFSRGKVRKYPIFTIGKETVEVVSNFLYLGIKLNYNNRMSVAQKDLYDRASRATFSLLRRCNRLDLPTDIILDLFEKTIIPIMTYGCELWGFENCEILQKLQLKYYKIILKLRVSTPSLMVYGETGKYPLCVIVKTRVLTYWFKLINDINKNKLASVVYRILLTLSEKGIHNNPYLMFVRTSLIEVGLSHLWLTHDTTNINLSWFKSHVKKRLQDLFIQQWFSHIDIDSVYLNYRLFKNKFQQEPFLNILPNNCSITLIRFRTTNNCLPVNVLRHEGIPREERICTKCSMQDIGDEYHYILICPFFKKKRANILPKRYIRNPNILKYNELFNSTDKTLLLKLKHFICTINNELK